MAAALEESHGPADAGPPEIDEAAALARLARLAEFERRVPLRDLTEAAHARDLPWLLDDDELSVGAGAGSRRYALEALPAVAEVPWTELHGVPTALVTGSNGKTTTVRLIAACNRAQGRRPGYSCTDGLFVGDEWIERGDYSGPVGARTVLRDQRVEAAVLETARGGILRRGLAVARADVAVVTNVSADHFGEYGIHDLDSLADVKLTVGAVVPPGGLLVLNADDATLRAKAAGLARRYGRDLPLGWFAQDADDVLLAQHRGAGGASCGVPLPAGCCSHATASSTTSARSPACRSRWEGARRTTSPTWPPRRLRRLRWASRLNWSRRCSRASARTRRTIPAD